MNRARRGEEVILNGRNSRIETTLAARKKRTSYSTTSDQRILQLTEKYYTASEERLRRRV